MLGKYERKMVACQHYDTYTAYYRKFFILQKIFGIACEDCDVWIDLNGSE